MLFFTHQKFLKELANYTESHTVGCLIKVVKTEFVRWNVLKPNNIFFDVQLKNHKINQSPIKLFIAIKTQAG